jgi:hypothetical protein
MLKLSDAHHFRRIVCGACMVVAPLVLLVSSIVGPITSSTKEASILRAIDGHRDRFYISTLLLIAGVVLMLPAVLGLMHMLRERRAAIGHIGGALTLVGVMTFMLFGGVSLVQWQMVRGGADRAQMVSLLHRFDHTAGTQMFLFLSLAFLVGMIVLALGLYLAQAVHWSTATILTIGVVVLQVGLISNVSALFIIASAILFIGFATIGWRVLTESDEQWDHTPEWKGFRPVATH